MDIEIIEDQKINAEELRKNYLAKSFEIKQSKETLTNNMIKVYGTDNVDKYYSDIELLKDLINTVIEVSFNEGKSFGVEKVIYKEREDERGKWDYEKVYPKAGTGAYQGD